ncbi:disease resistance protein RUN1-like isoform X3 [Prosopis cineraria]|uniref:disease resistance protein RUN1-like isoform X3 n=1 Tax=Prosopis cineraria TaxID=364024 RepID=UPI00240F4178|nr:disease resistance protein RUN1-like isoform X3 [Prosopis cineraria]
MDAAIALTLIGALLILLALPISKAIRFVASSLCGIRPVAINECSCKDAADSISMVSSQMIVTPVIKYDVFLSFRGEDTRDNFTSYLYEALCNANIHTFMDVKLDKGEQISPILLRTIEESKISLIIFSKDYASSSWCMEELVHILECKKKFGRIVIPIFYKVDPSNIRKQNGSFGEGFAKLKQKFRQSQDKVQKWTNVLIQSSSLSGWDSRNIRPEPKLIKEIIKDILSKLNHNSSYHFEGLAGIDHNIENIKKLLSEACIVGICGMGGAGKSTLAKVVFHKLKSQFGAFSLVENVRERLARIGLDKLQEECLKELLNDDDINAFDIKSTFVKSRLQRKKILLVLDDVDNSIIAEDLTKVYNWFGEGSRIIITSRDMQVLKNASAHSIYHVPSLDFHDAIHLFSLKAFKQNEPSKDYKELSKLVIHYCQGNPLALVVLGCFLYGRGKEEWESALEKLNEAPPKDIVDVLKLSFDGLDDKQKNVFLDLTFFIKDTDGINLELTRQLHGSSVHVDISVLKERSLISEDEYGYFVMHDLVGKMGLEIARQQLFFGLENPVRLWWHEDIQKFFIYNKHFPNLKLINLRGSKSLTALPDLSCAPKVEYIYLVGCVKLAQIHSSTVMGELCRLNLEDSGRKQINIGGTIEDHQRSSPALVIDYNYLDTIDLSFNKVRMKLFLSDDGNIISGVGLKHVVMLLENNSKSADQLKLRTQSLTSLLPFVSTVKWFRVFKQHENYDDRFYNCHNDPSGNDISINVGVRISDEAESIVVGSLPLRRSEEGTALELDEEEDGEDELMEEEECETNMRLTRLPNHITCWSLLTQVRLNESNVIGNAGCSIPQVSILKSLALSHHCKRIQPLLDLTLSFDITAPDYHRPYSFWLPYSMPSTEARYLKSFRCYFEYTVDHIVFEYTEW